MSEPIAAIATAAGPAAIAIVRLSGAGCIAIARTFLVGLPAELAPRRLTPAMVVSASGEPLDDVLVAVFPGPASYTGEDVVEIQCHGGLAVAGAVEARALAAGVRRATGGEFTARAVENGKMDLLDAEALGALLVADDLQGLSAARALRTVGAHLRALRLRVRSALAALRGMLDYPVETQGPRPHFRSEADSVRAALSALRAGTQAEPMLRDGTTVAFIGPPNSGKSSLVNALSGEARALVDATPGTTRDALFASLLFGGRRVTLIDTAGLREAEGLEGRGIERAKQVAAQAAVRVWVEDIASLPCPPPPDLVPELHILSKADLAPHPARQANSTALRLSAHRGEGIAELQQRLTALAAAPALVLTTRQTQGIAAALAALEGIDDLAEDLFAERLEEADQQLSALVGERASAVSASEVYAHFCIGK